MDVIEPGITGLESRNRVNSNFTKSIERDSVPNATTEKQISDVRLVGDNVIAPNIPNCYPERNDTVGISFVFVFDSNRKEIIEQYTRAESGFPVGGWVSLFEDRGIRLNVSCGLFDAPYDDDFPASTMVTLEANGHEYMAHALIATYPDATEEELAVVLDAQRAYFQSEGLNPKHCNYFGGYNDIAAASVLRKYYKSAGTVVSPAEKEYMPLNLYKLSRIPMDTCVYTTWKSHVDNIIAKGQGIMTFYCHPYADALYDAPRDDAGNLDAEGDYGWQKIVRLLDYILGQATYGTTGGILIQTISDAVDSHDSLIDAGYGSYNSYITDPDNFGKSDYFRLSKSGAVSSKKLDCIEVETRTILGKAAGHDATNGTLIAIGNSAARDFIGGAPSICIGLSAGRGATAGVVAVGSQAGLQNSQGTVVVIGDQAGYKNSGLGLVAVGNNAGYKNSGFGCVAIGRDSLYENMAAQVTAIGDNSGKSNSGIQVVAIGLYAGNANTKNYLTALGAYSGQNNTGLNSSFLGFKAGQNNTGDYVVAIGHEAGSANAESDVFIVKHSTRNANPLIKGYWSGGIILGAPATAVADATMGANRVSFYLDEGNNKLMFKIKYADGATIKTGEIALI